MITATPTSYEIYDDDAKMLVATITMFDEGASEVVIKGVNNATSWLELSRSIHEALKIMHPDVTPWPNAPANTLRSGEK